jgi:hypothetical protein
MRISTCVRLGGVLAAVVLTLGSAGSKHPKRGATKTVNELTVYQTRPTFTWKAEKGAAYHLELDRVPAKPAKRTVAFDAHGVADGTWTVPGDLELGVRYELFLTYEKNVHVLTSWGFTVGMEQPKLAAPAEGASLTTLSPTLEVAPLAYDAVAYTIDLATDAQFGTPIANAQLRAPQLTWAPPLLQAGMTYHWRLRAYHFAHGAATTDLATAIGTTEATGAFSVAAQSGPDALSGLTWLMNEPAGTSMPALSKKLDLAYVVEGDGGASTIRIAPAPPKAKAPTYGDAREDLTEAVGGSRDLHPVWDVDGKGVFFDSNRSQGVRNIWFKKRDSSGYTQITFSDKDASNPSLSKDGKKLVYESAGEVWLADRDGKNAVSLGTGSAPRFSPDGKLIAFANNGGIWVMDFAGQGAVQLTTGPGDAQPAWVGNETIVFVSARAGNDDLWSVPALGGEPVQLTTYLGRDTDPTAAGKHVLFASQRGGTSLGVWIGQL